MTDPSRKRELSKDLDSYIESRRRGDETTLIHENVRHQEEEDEAPVAHVEDTTGPAKKNWFSSFMDKLFQPGEEAPAHDHVVMSDNMSNGEIKQDMRDLASISLAVIKQLPERTLKEFKESSDFVRFKEILKKHTIIK